MLPDWHGTSTGKILGLYPSTTIGCQQGCMTLYIYRQNERRMSFNKNTVGCLHDSLVTTSTGKTQSWCHSTTIRNLADTTRKKASEILQPDQCGWLLWLMHLQYVELMIRTSSMAVTAGCRHEVVWQMSGPALLPDLIRRGCPLSAVSMLYLG